MSRPLHANHFDVLVSQGEALLQTGSLRKAAGQFQQAWTLRQDAGVKRKLVQTLERLGRESIPRKQYSDTAYAIASLKALDGTEPVWKSLEADIESVCMRSTAGYAEVLYLVDEVEPLIREYLAHASEPLHDRIAARLSHALVVMDLLAKDLRSRLEAMPGSVDRSQAEYQYEQLLHRKLWAEYYQLQLLDVHSDAYERQLHDLCREFVHTLSRQGAWTPLYSYILAGLSLKEAGRCEDALGYFDYLVEAELPAGMEDIRREAMLYKARCLLDLGRNHKVQKTCAAFREAYPLSIRSETGYQMTLVEFEAAVSMALEQAEGGEAQTALLLTAIGKLMDCDAWPEPHRSEGLALFGQFAQKIRVDKLQDRECLLALEVYYAQSDFEAIRPMLARLETMPLSPALKRKYDFLSAGLAYMDGRVARARSVLETLSFDVEPNREKYKILAGIELFRRRDGTVDKQDVLAELHAFAEKYGNMEAVHLVHLKMAEVLEEHDQREDAMVFYSKIPRRSTYWERAVYQSGQAAWELFLARGNAAQLASAREHFKQLADAGEGGGLWKIAATDQLIHVLIKREEFPQARRYTDQLRQLAGQDRQWRNRVIHAEMQLAAATGDLAKLREHLAELEQAHMDEREKQQTMLHAGMLLYEMWRKQGDALLRDLSFEVLAKSLSTDPRSFSRGLWLASRMEQAGDWMGSVRVYEHCRRLVPEEDAGTAGAIDAHIAQAYLRLEQWDRALAIFLGLEKQFPRNREVLRGLAQIYEERGSSEAIAYYRRLLRLVEKNGAEWYAIKYRLALLHRQFGNADLARRVLLTTLLQYPRLNGDEVLLEKYRDLLDRLEKDGAKP